MQSGNDFVPLLAAASGRGLQAALLMHSKLHVKACLFCASRDNKETIRRCSVVHIHSVFDSSFMWCVQRQQGGG